MICIEPIACANVERVAYIIYQDKHRGIHKCIGRFIEQENDAGECQFLFVMDWNSLTEEDLDYVCTWKGRHLVTENLYQKGSDGDSSWQELELFHIVERNFMENRGESWKSVENCGKSWKIKKNRYNGSLARLLFVWEKFPESLKNCPHMIRTLTL